MKTGSKLQTSLSSTDPITHLTSKIPQKSERKCDAEQGELGSSNIKEDHDIIQKS